MTNSQPLLTVNVDLTSGVSHKLTMDQGGLDGLIDLITRDPNSVMSASGPTTGTVLIVVRHIVRLRVEQS